MKTETKNAINIAKTQLRLCYTKEGIIAGTHHFTDYWARDGYFAALGSIAIGDDKKVQDMVELFFKHQRKDGLIPYRIMRGPISLKKYFGKPDFYDIPRPTYKLRGFGNEVLDGTTLTILFASLLSLKGKVEIKKFTPQIKKALKYLLSREKNGLLWDGVMAEWNDTALKYGNLLYSNIIYWYMYNRLFQAAVVQDKKWSQILAKKTKDIQNSIYDRLWNGNFFTDWNDYKKQNYFYPFGNCLAITWGLTNPTESNSILNKCKKIKIDFTLESNFPKYPAWRIDPIQSIFGMGDYQNQSVLWWQPIAAYLAALKKMKRKKEASEIENKVITKILNDKTIYECYERNGSPVNRLLYKSEHPFAWASGMILWSIKY